MPKEPQALRILIYERYWDEADTDRDVDTNRAGLDCTDCAGLYTIWHNKYGRRRMQKDATGGAGQCGRGAGGEMTGLSPINKPSWRGRRHQSCGQG